MTLQDFLESDIGRGLVGDDKAWFRLTDLQGNYLYVSPSVEQFLGYRPDEFLGQAGFDLLHPDDVERAKHVLEHLKDGPIGAVYRMRHKEGHYVWVNTHIQILQNMIIAVGTQVPERLQGFAWNHVEPFL